MAETALPSLLAAGFDATRAREAFEALVRVADAQPERKQACADDICAWLRLLWGPGCLAHSDDSGVDALAEDVGNFLTDRLSDPSALSTFCGLDLDFSRTIIRKLNFRGAHFSGGRIDFRGCLFDDSVSFAEASFTAGWVMFDGSAFREPSEARSSRFTGAAFDGAVVTFGSTEFRNGAMSFVGCRFAGGEILFDRMKLTDSSLLFTGTEFSGAIVSFADAHFASGLVSFANCQLTAGLLSFEGARVGVRLLFDSAVLNGGNLTFDGARLGQVSFSRFKLLSGRLSLRQIFAAGGDIRFEEMEMQGGKLLLDEAKILFGRVLLDRITLEGGVLSLENVILEFEGSLHLPWGIYAAGVVELIDDVFDGRTEHSFHQKTANYRSDTEVRWGRFRPEHLDH